MTNTEAGNAGPLECVAGEAASSLGHSAKALPAMHAHAGYALFLDLTDRLVVVIGGGTIAQHKVETVIPFGARIVIVSPQITDGLRKLAENGALEWVPREYREGDLKDARLVFSACGVPSVDDAVREEALRERALINIVDVPAKCEFIVPSTVDRGPLRIAVSTSGCAPTEAKRIRRKLENDFDESWEPYLQLMQSFRALVKTRILESDEARKPVFEAATQAGWRERLAAGENITPEQAYAEAIKKAGVNL